MPCMHNINKLPQHARPSHIAYGLCRLLVPPVLYLSFLYHKAIRYFLLILSQTVRIMNYIEYGAVETTCDNKRAQECGRN